MTGPTTESAQKKQRGRLWRWGKWVVIFIVAVTACSLIGQAVGILQTAEEIQATDTAEAIALEQTALASITPSATMTASNTPTATNTATDTLTPTNTLTPTETFTPTETDTQTPTFTPSDTPTATDTATDTMTPTSTDTPSDTPTVTNTATHTATPTSTDTATNTMTPTRTDTPTNTLTPTITLTASDTFTPVPTRTPRPTNTARPTDYPVIPMDSDMWVVNNVVNARTCPLTNCEVLGQFTAGEFIGINGRAIGTEVYGSNIWYRTMYLGETAFVHSGAVTRASTETPVPATPDFDEDAYVRYIEDSLSLNASNIDVSSVLVADGRAEGGERSVILAYRSAATEEVGLLIEWLTLYNAIAEAIDEHDLDLDSISFAVGDAAGNAAGIVIVSVDDVLDYVHGQITNEEFSERILILPLGG